MDSSKTEKEKEQKNQQKHPKPQRNSNCLFVQDTNH